MTVFYHTPPDGVLRDEVKAWPFPTARSRQSETAELRSDLRSLGIAPPYRIVWLALKPISHPYYIINGDLLEERALVPTYDANGYHIHVGAIPAHAIVGAWTMEEYE